MELKRFMKLFTSSFCAIKSGVGLGFPVRGIPPSCSDNGILSDFHTIEFTLWNRKILNMSNKDMMDQFHFHVTDNYGV